MLVLLLGLLWVSGRSESNPAGLTVSASDTENAAVPGPAAVAAKESSERSASKSDSAEEISPILASITFLNEGEMLAAPYKQQPWHSCAVKLANSLINWGGCHYSPRGGNCRSEGASMTMSMLRRTQTAYGTEFTLHARGVDPTGKDFVYNYLCHLGPQNQIISFNLVDL